MSNLDDLTKLIQNAVESSERSNEYKEALRYMKEVLPQHVMAVHGLNGVFLQFLEVESGIDNTRRVLVGEDNNGPKNTRMHKHSTYDYRFETQSSKRKAYINFSGPRLDEVWSDVRGCAIAAAVSSVVVAILAQSYEAAHAHFYPAFYACCVSRFGDRAKEIDVSYECVSENGCWENHCG